MVEFKVSMVVSTDLVQVARHLLVKKSIDSLF